MSTQLAEYGQRVLDLLAQEDKYAPGHKLDTLYHITGLAYDMGLARLTEEGDFILLPQKSSPEKFPG